MSWRLHLGTEGRQKQNVMGSGRMAEASVTKPDCSSSWEEAIEDYIQSVLCCALHLPLGDLWLQVPCAGRECPGPCGSAGLFPPLATCLCGGHGHTSGPLC